MSLTVPVGIKDKEEEEENSYSIKAVFFVCQHSFEIFDILAISIAQDHTMQHMRFATKSFFVCDLNRFYDYI